jgi:hypothetical protein
MSQQTAKAPLNWFREGLFAPVTEEVTAFALPVNAHTVRIEWPLFAQRSEFHARPRRSQEPLVPGLRHGPRREVAGRPGGMVPQSVRSKDVAEALGEKSHEGPIHDEAQLRSPPLVTAAA